MTIPENPQTVDVQFMRDLLKLAVTGGISPEMLEQLLQTPLSAESTALLDTVMTSEQKAALELMATFFHSNASESSE